MTYKKDARMGENSRIVSVEELLNMKLKIPNYQRPYTWTRKNVSDLLNDIEEAITESQRPEYSDFAYRIGTIILHNPAKENNGDSEPYNIVDGQQRLLTLSLLRHALDTNFVNSLIGEQKFTDTVSVEHILDNYQLIREWLSVDSGRVEKYLNALQQILEAVILEVNDISEAFQLFDSQNTRGKELDPHDLLKAYHLREMIDYPFEKLNLIRRWEEIAPYRIRELFSLYLYPILNWSRKEKTDAFTANKIDIYKGVSTECHYTYAERVKKSMPYFQINLPFSAGTDFFKMTEHYIKLLDNLINEIKTNDLFDKIQKTLSRYMKRKSEDDPQFYSTGFRYAVNLFYCVLLFYYDRFHLLDEMAVKKLFAWSMMIRVDMDHLGFDTINNYAVGNEDNSSYSNHIPMFYKIASARTSSEISNLHIQIKNERDDAKTDSWKGLYSDLKNLMGVK